MNLNSLFHAVTTGRFRSADGSFLWVCPLCDGHVETEASPQDRDRRALLHCVHHRGPQPSKIQHLAANRVFLLTGVSTSKTRAREITGAPVRLWSNFDILPGTSTRGRVGTT
ncbi:MAG: hypothetical protein BMS9Abin37_2888 [Acidobacteriota bacterium]|nr:MAG: hypothetical protein BMS9Abin37_2888 [Acidobacteriota bacterium]